MSGNRRRGGASSAGQHEEQGDAHKEQQPQARRRGQPQQTARAGGTPFHAQPRLGYPQPTPEQFALASQPVERGVGFGEVWPHPRDLFPLFGRLGFEVGGDALALLPLAHRPPRGLFVGAGFGAAGRGRRIAMILGLRRQFLSRLRGLRHQIRQPVAATLVLGQRGIDLLPGVLQPLQNVRRLGVQPPQRPVAQRRPPPHRRRRSQTQ